MLLTLLALLGKAGGGVVGRSALVIGLSLLQPIVAFVPRVDAPAISALHALNALVILIVITQLVRGESAQEALQVPASQ